MDTNNISIIIPVHNSEKNLVKCLESIYNQKNNSFEVIIIDDGSTDRSVQICDEHAERYENCSVYHIRNRGVSYARNLGIKKAKGEYIMFCDSDDTVEDTWCENLYGAICKSPDSWVMCGCTYVDAESQETKKRITYTEDESISVISKSDYYEIFNLGISGYVWNHIYKSEVLKKHNICFDENTDYAEDALFNNEYLNHCKNICFVNKFLYNYYVSDSLGLSHKYYPDFYVKLKKVYLSRKRFISEKHLPEFCYEYFYLFNSSLKNTFDNRNKKSFFGKIMYNHDVINDDAFKDCLENMKVPEEDKKYVDLLKKGIYILVYLADKL